MSHSLCIAATWIVALALPARASPVLSQGSHLVRVAQALEHFEVDRLLLDTDFALPEETLAAVAAMEVEALERLLAHEGGAVRTLAIAGLYFRLGPQALPLLVPLVEDGGAAPPMRVPTSMILRKPQPTAPQTVGDIARRVIEYHLEQAGYRGGIEGRYGAPGFEVYWAERGDRSHCLSWWRIALGRASRSASPTPSDRLDEIVALRRQIDRLPAAERAWVLLALCSPWEGGAGAPGATELASEADLVRAALDLREAGLLLPLLRGEDLASDDPDVRLTAPTAFPYERVVPFVLRHARELLAPEVVPELLTLERRHISGEPVGDAPQCITASWSIAAADLSPGLACETLHRALKLYSDQDASYAQDRRCFLAQALWRHCGEAETQTIVDWFFEEEPQRGSFGFGRHRFADWLAKPARRGALRAILRDGRSKELDWQTLRRLAESVNRSSGREIVPATELRSVIHPLGEGHYHWATAEERDRHPEKTSALEATLASWRSLLARWAR